MDARSLRVLEFYSLLEILKGLTLSSLGRMRCETLTPFHDLTQIQSRLTEVLELKESLEAFGDIPIHGLKDIGEIFERLDVEGTVLTAQELLDIYGQIELCKGLRRYFHRLELGKAPLLQERVSRLSQQKNLEREILQAIDPKGEILDRASPALSEIRHRLKAIRERARAILDHLLHQEDLEPVFQDQFITIRNGRYVLPVKSECKNRLEGIVHDQSQTRMTLFVEPLQVVALNNEINILMGEEKEEEYRILSVLSGEVRQELQSLRGDLSVLGAFDLLHAMARLSMSLKAVQPILRTDGKTDIREARHPLLFLQKGAEVVPIHLKMGDGIKTLMISGANAGGKTVALKTLGLLTLMAQSGLPVPAAEGSEIAIFEDLFAIVGDEQNLSENLSTFSSHLLHLGEISNKAGPHSLVLLDELGVGTDAQEGSALAMGFLDRFREIGCSVVVTTHFSRLKAYGYLHGDVENIAVDFDEKTLEPKYTLAYGLSGVSNAFLVAEKLGISEEILGMARRYLEGGDEGISQVLEALERLKEEAKGKRLELLKLEQEVLSQQRKLKEFVEGIRRKKQEIYAQMEEKARKRIQALEEELKEWGRRKKETKTPLITQRRELHAIKEKFSPSHGVKSRQGVPTDLRVGDRVKIESLRSEGVLMKTEHSLDRAEVMTEKGRVKASLSDLSKAREEQEPTKAEPAKVHAFWHQSAQEPPTQLNVIGLTVEDALPIVDKFIDQALLNGMEKVQIIHGVGSGRLRSGIGKFLQAHRRVKRIAPGEGMRGGGAVTVVELS